MREGTLGSQVFRVAVQVDFLGSPVSAGTLGSVEDRGAAGIPDSRATLDLAEHLDIQATADSQGSVVFPATQATAAAEEAGTADTQATVGYLDTRASVGCQGIRGSLP